jgi:transmembrane sensor
VVRLFGEIDYKMEKYTRFRAVDFAQDEAFVQWVKEGSRHRELDQQWKEWLRLHPDKRETVEESIRMIRSIQEEKQYFPAAEKQREMWSRIEDSIAPFEVEDTPVVTNRFSWTSWYSIAATVVLVMIAGVWLIRTVWPLSFSAAEENSYRGIAKDLVQYRNEGDKPHILILQDGSKITLQPNSAIRYPDKFLADRRDVYLTGEAFFDVARDTQRPFSVYANKLVTQVLGTSFSIRAYEEEGDILVAVKTGKVSVFTEAGKRSKSPNKDPQSEGAVLTPNQQIIFSKRESRMIKSLVDDPMVLSEGTKRTSFHFTDTPIREVFSLLEKSYGVDIVYDEEVMSNCYLNASLDSLSFYDKLRLISKGINVRYEILDAHVIISGNGCD